MRTDGWVKRAADELRRLEEEADQVLANDLAGFAMGLDLARGLDRTVYRCSCGEFSSESLEDLANHAIRGHRWPEGDGTL